MKRYIRRPWTHEERKLLREHYYTLSRDALVELFPDRTINSITKQVSYLKKRGWTFNKEL